MKYATWKQQSVIDSLEREGYLTKIEIKAPKGQDEDSPYSNLEIGRASELIGLGKLRQDHGVKIKNGIWEKYNYIKHAYSPVTPETFEFFKLPEIYAESETEVGR